MSQHVKDDDLSGTLGQLSGQLLATVGGAGGASGGRPSPGPSGSGRSLSRRVDLLIVDDESPVARGLARVLGLQHDVRIALSTQEALHAIRLRVPDALLCDYKLGAQTSVSLLDYVRRRFPHVRRVLYSASRPEVWQPLIDSELIHASVMKPGTPEQLFGALGL